METISFGQRQSHQGFIIQAVEAITFLTAGWQCEILNANKLTSEMNKLHSLSIIRLASQEHKIHTFEH